MSSTVSCQVQGSVGASLTPTSGFLSGQQVPLNLPLKLGISDGTAADKANLVYANTISLAAAPTSLDLTSLTDVLGASLAFAKVRLIALRNNDTTDGHTVAVGNSGSNDFAGIVSTGGTITLYPSTASNSAGGFVVFTAPNTTGMAVDSTHKILKLDPGANTISVSVVIVGTNA